MAFFRYPANMYIVRDVVYQWKGQFLVFETQNISIDDRAASPPKVIFMSAWQFDNPKALLRIITGIFLILYILGTSTPAKTTVMAELGVPVQVREVVELGNCRIVQLADDENYLYVLISNPRGYILVYDLDGKYSHAISIFHTSKGQFRLATEDNVLYVSDTVGNIYIFRDGTHERFILAEDARELGMLSRFNRTSSNYKLRWGSVWRIGDEKTCVIRRPLLSCIPQYHLVYFFLLVLVLVKVLQPWVKKPTIHFL